MSVSFRCPSCHTAFRVEESSLGKTVICPNPGCYQKSVLPKVAGTQSSGTTSSRKRPGGAKPAIQSRQQRFAKAAEPVVEKSNPSSVRFSERLIADQSGHTFGFAACDIDGDGDLDLVLVAAPQQPINKTPISRELLLIAGIGSAAVILIAVLGLVLVLRQSPNEQGTLVAATDQTTSEVRIGDALQPSDSAIESAAQTPASATNDEQSSLKRQSPVTVNSKGANASATVSTQPQSLTVEEVASKTEASIAFIEGGTGSGTGFLIHDGILATNRHVINEEFIEQLKIHFPSAPAGEQGPFTAELIYKDPDKDLAFLKVETSLPPLTTPAQHSFRRGQDVIVIGNPGIGDQVLKNAVNTGNLSTEVMLDGQQYYQLGISINGGNSGGPVLDMSGEVLGVATLGWNGKEGLAACVPLPQLTEALAKARNISESEIAVIRSEHRLGVVVRTVSIMTDAYETGMRTYLDSMVNASKAGKTDSSGLEQVRDDVSKELLRMNDLFVDADVSREASRVSSDSNIPERVREQFAELWTNYKEMKSNVENPRPDLSAFYEKYLQLTESNERLMNALNLHLGIAEDE